MTVWTGGNSNVVPDPTGFPALGQENATHSTAYSGSNMMLLQWKGRKWTRWQESATSRFPGIDKLASDMFAKCSRLSMEKEHDVPVTKGQGTSAVYFCDLVTRWNLDKVPGLIPGAE